MKVTHATLGIVDNDPFALRAMSAFLNKALPPEFEIICLLSDPQQAIAQCSGRHAPDLLLVDMSLGDTDGVYVMRKIREHNAKIVLLAITSFSLHEYAQNAMDAGAQGIAGKNDLPAIVMLIKQALSGRGGTDYGDIHFDDARTAYSRVAHSDKDGVPSLSIRENEIIELCSMGNTTVEISRILTISENTVNTHLQRACEKLQAGQDGPVIVTEAVHSEIKGIVTETFANLRRHCAPPTDYSIRVAIGDNSFNLIEMNTLSIHEQLHDQPLLQPSGKGLQLHCHIIESLGGSLAASQDQRNMDTAGFDALGPVSCLKR
jgi:DNA-binding NarL/FixJ family response regulator